jgi:hypothetical protein
VPDYLADLREVIRRGEGSALRRDMVLKKVRRLEIESRRVGKDVNDLPQIDFCKMLQGDTKDWMFRLCAARLLRGDYSDWTGWEYRNQWATDSYSPQVPNKRWRLEPIKSLAILGEQGVGDEVMFSSCIPDVQKLVPRVVVECDPRLQTIFERSFGCETKPRDDIINRGKSNYLTAKRSEDAFIPIGDLPRLFRKSGFPGNPFLKPDPEKVKKWSGLKGKTGLAWRGRRGQFDPKELMRVFDVKDAVSLQYDGWEYETGGMVVPDCDLHNDLEDVLGICANLERVVTVPQSIVHFSGPIGLPVDVVIPPVKSGRVMDQINWRYGKGGRSMPFYTSVTVFNSLNEYASQR